MEKIEVTFPQETFEKFKETFDLEIEILKGETVNLPNNWIRCTLFVDGYKLEMIKDFCNMLMQVPTDKIRVKYFGTNINPN